MNSVDTSYTDEYRPGDRIKVIDGTFVGSVGYVIDAKEAHARWERCGGQQPPTRTPAVCIWVVITVFNRPGPVMLHRFQVQHAAN
jgi:hypothetical protein